MRVPLPARLQAVPPLGPYEWTVGQLGAAQIGCTIVIKRTVLCVGKIDGVSESRTSPSYRIVYVGSGRDRQTFALHHSDVVTVVPRGGRINIELVEGEEPE